MSDVLQLVQMKFGSQLYGTATANSDLDLKAVHIPSARDILLQRANKVINSQTKVNATDKNTADDIDFESFALQHFMKLLLEGQTICMDMLFAPVDKIMVKTPQWEYIVDNKSRLISKQSKSFIGYCRQQASKYGVKGERVAAIRRIVELLGCLPPRSKLRDHHLYLTQLVQEDLHGFTQIVDIQLAYETVIKHLSVCDRKVPFTVTVKDGLTIYDRVLREYGNRALAAEATSGVDWKAMSHAVRIGRQGIDLLTHGEIIFPLPYAEELVKIKTGQADFQATSELIDQLLTDVEDAAAKSSLPDLPDYDFAEALILEQYRNRVCQNLS